MWRRKRSMRQDASISTGGWVTLIVTCTDLRLPDVSGNKLALCHIEAQCGAQLITARWRGSLSSLYWDFTTSRFNFLKNTRFRIFHITFSLLLPFSKSQQRWNEEQVKEHVQECMKRVSKDGGRTALTRLQQDVIRSGDEISVNVCSKTGKTRRFDGQTISLIQSACWDVWKNLNFPSMSIIHMTECLTFKRERHTAHTVYPVAQMKNKGDKDAAASQKEGLVDWGVGGCVHIHLQKTALLNAQNKVAVHF